MSSQIVGIVPMRHSSQRIPGKNYRDFAGKPLFHHVIIALQESGVIDKIVIDTDSPIVMEQTAKHFPGVIILERPAHLRDGSIPMNDVLLNVLNSVPSAFYLQTHSTNPILSGKTVAEAVHKFHSLYPQYDSLFSVTKKKCPILGYSGKTG